MFWLKSFISVIVEICSKPSTLDPPQKNECSGFLIIAAQRTGFNKRPGQGGGPGKLENATRGGSSAADELQGALIENSSTWQQGPLEWEPSLCVCVCVRVSKS